MVIADGPIPPGINVRGFNHVLGECGFCRYRNRARVVKLNDLAVGQS